MPATRFTSRRGRPKSAHTGTDYGTPELILKRACNQTQEAIDLCLARALITPQQHWCALHLRWLYTIRYGAPGVTAMDLLRGQGTALISEDNPQWLGAREAEFNEAAAHLSTRQRYQPVAQLAIYNERPAYLDHATLQRAFDSPALAKKIDRDITHLQEGLELLVQLWKRK